MIFTDNKDYYPTPEPLARKMWQIIPKRERQNLYYILDPQAGTGHLLERLRKMGDRYRQKLFAIEKDLSMCATLSGKKFHVISNDFLSYDGPDKFDLIFMNPPFSNGDHHLLKAIDIMYAGHIVCVLNAVTVRTPKTIIQQQLVGKLKAYGATIEYHKDEFVASERRTHVEIALIHIHIKRKIEQDLFKGVTNAPKDPHADIEELKGETSLTEKESIKNLVADYNEKLSIGTQTLMDYYKHHHKIGGYIKIKTDKEDSDYFDSKELTDIMKFKLNNFITAIRKDYWGKALALDAIRKRLTKKRQDEFYQKLKDNEHMDFTENNVRTFILNLIENYESILTKAVLEIFDAMTVKFSWDENEDNGNIHYFNGWKTNKAFYVNEKVILPCWGCLGRPFWDSSWGRWHLDWDVERKLNDIDIVMNYFDGMAEHRRISEVLKYNFAKDLSTRGILSTYFKMSVFKKGTIHLTFRSEDIRRRFNVTACKGKGWLPQDYGVEPFAQLSHHKQEIVKSFEGEKSYTANLSPDRTLFKMKNRIQIEFQEELTQEAA